MLSVPSVLVCPPMSSAEIAVSLRVKTRISAVTKAVAAENMCAASGFLRRTPGQALSHAFREAPGSLIRFRSPACGTAVRFQPGYSDLKSVTKTRFEPQQPSGLQTPLKSWPPSEPSLLFGPEPPLALRLPSGCSRLTMQRMSVPQTAASRFLTHGKPAPHADAGSPPHLFNYLLSPVLSS